MVCKRKKKNTFVAEIAAISYFFRYLHPISDKCLLERCSSG